MRTLIHNERNPSGENNQQRYQSGVGQQPSAGQFQSPEDMRGSQVSSGASSGDKFGGASYAPASSQRSQSTSVSGKRKDVKLTMDVFAAHSGSKERGAVADLDSHADTCRLGPGFCIIEQTGKCCDVSPYDHSRITRDVPIVLGATAYTYTVSGMTYILTFGQSLSFGNRIDHSLLNPNQLRSHGLIVDDVPKHLSYDHHSTHSITYYDKTFNIPLSIRGIISSFEIHFSSREELDSCEWINMTTHIVEWDPYSSAFAENEDEVLTNEFQKTNDSRELFEVGLLSKSYDDYSVLNCIREMCASTITKKDTLRAEDLSRTLKIGLQTDHDAIKVMTQKVIHNAVHPLQRRFRTMQQQLRYNYLGGTHGRLYSVTLISRLRSIRGNNVAQIFVNNAKWNKVVPIPTKAHASTALKITVQDIGIPSHIHTDGAREMTRGEWKEYCDLLGIKMTHVEAHSTFQNKVELGIKELKHDLKNRMILTKTPSRLWDYCLEYCADNNKILPHPLPVLQGRTPLELMIGHTPDISEYSEFGWYDPIYYFDSNAFPDGQENIGRWLGVSHRIGQALCFWILSDTAQV